MSLLDIVQEAFAIIGLEEVSQVIGNSEQNVRQLRSLIQQGGNQIARTSNADGGTWSVLERIYEFPTEADKTEYDLPTDFERLVSETAWQKDKYWRMRGSIPPKQWQSIRNRQATVPYNVFRVLRTQSESVGNINPNTAPQRLRKFTLEPAPGENITLVYEYISRAWWIDQAGYQFKRKPTQDTDESVFGDDIHVLDAVWRFKSANGLKFSDELAIFEMERDRMLVQDASAEYIAVGHDRRLGANYWESDIEWPAV